MDSLQWWESLHPHNGGLYWTYGTRYCTHRFGNVEIEGKGFRALCIHNPQSTSTAGRDLGVFTTVGEAQQAVEAAVVERELAHGAR